MSGGKCKNCGSSDIEVDPARGDAVCTNCGSVLEDSIIVAEIEFVEGAHGSSNAIGQFVSADSKGGVTKLGASLHVGLGVESRELTLRRAREGISLICNQLRLNQRYIDTACNFFKCALNRNLTRGRRNTHIRAACVYLTCRTEKTGHLLIDISDVMQICCYELGRTYLRLSQALHINIPAVDPCIYVMRFAAKLEFASKTNLVTQTALRLVARMKRDSIHSGRRPSGLCGAALLIAARLHEFNRTASDIVKIVKVHESTLRKRLIEFGDTPSSALTLEEFMTVDLEQEQDPPSFKAARKKDKERLQKVLEDEVDKITEFQRDIERQLERNHKLRRVRKDSATEEDDTNQFIKDSTVGTINKIINEESVDDVDDTFTVGKEIQGLGPNIASMGLANSLTDTTNSFVSQPNEPTEEIDVSLDDIDDEEIDAYIMTEHEYRTKHDIWHERNGAFLEEQRLKEEEKLRKQLEEGKSEKKRKKPTRKKAMAPTNSASEAIEKIVQEKKISNKINYDVLKYLNAPSPQINEPADDNTSNDMLEAISRRRLSSVSSLLESSPAKIRKLTPKLSNSSRNNTKKNESIGLPLIEEPKADSTVKKDQLSEEETDEYEEDDHVPEPSTEIGVMEMLRQHNNTAGEEEFDGYESEYGW